MVEGVGTGRSSWARVRAWWLGHLFAILVWVVVLGALATVALGWWAYGEAAGSTPAEKLADLEPLATTIGKLGPVATFFAAALAALVALRTQRHRARADARAEWWRRAQWAVDAQLDPDEDTSAMGRLTFDALTADPELSDHESAYIQVITAAQFDLDLRRSAAGAAAGKRLDIRSRQAENGGTNEEEG